MKVLNKAPNTVVALCATAIVLALIGGAFALAYTGKDAKSLTDMVTTILSALGALTGTGAFLYSGAAAKSAAKAEEQTNGVLDTRIHNAVTHALQNAGVGIHNEAVNNDG